MAKVYVKIVIRKKKDEVYKVLLGMERYSEFLRDVKHISILTSAEDLIISEWKIDVDGTPIEWIQETTWDRTSQKWISFRMVQGDYQRYEGKWLLEEVGDGKTRVTLSAEFEWGVPGLERFVGSILEQKASDSLRGMLVAIRRELHRCPVSRGCE